LTRVAVDKLEVIIQFEGRRMDGSLHYFKIMLCTSLCGNWKKLIHAQKWFIAKKWDGKSLFDPSHF